MIRETSQRLEASKKQQLAMAEIQAESQLLMQKHQERAQAKSEQSGAMQGLESPVSLSRASPAASGGARFDMVSAAEKLAEQYLALPPDHREQALMTLESQTPEFAELVRQFLEQMDPGPAPGQAGPDASALSPLPEQRPPRRESTVI